MAVSPTAFAPPSSPAPAQPSPLGFRLLYGLPLSETVLRSSLPLSESTGAMRFPWRWGYSGLSPSSVRCLLPPHFPFLPPAQITVAPVGVG